VVAGLWIHDGQHRLEVGLVEVRERLLSLVSLEEVEEGDPGGQVEGVGGGEDKGVQAVSENAVVGEGCTRLGLEGEGE